MNKIELSKMKRKTIVNSEKQFWQLTIKEESFYLARHEPGWFDKEKQTLQKTLLKCGHLSNYVEDYEELLRKKLINKNENYIVWIFTPEIVENENDLDIFSKFLFTKNSNFKRQHQSPMDKKHIILEDSLK